MDGTVTSEGQITLCNPHRGHLINWPSLLSSFSLWIFAYMRVRIGTSHTNTSGVQVLSGVMQVSSMEARREEERPALHVNAKWDAEKRRGAVKWEVPHYAFHAVSTMQSRQEEDRLRKWGSKKLERCWLGSSEESGGGGGRVYVWCTHCLLSALLLDVLRLHKHMVLSYIFLYWVVWACIYIQTCRD